MREVKPYRQSNTTKKQEVTVMFDNIAPKYDLLNHLMSLGIDKLWRRTTVKLVATQSPKVILDVATGTGDLALAMLKLNPQRIEAIDIAPQMIEYAKPKVTMRDPRKLITLSVADSEALPFADEYFDAVSVGFGVRNFGDLKMGLAEMLRVTKPGGVVVILEFSRPRHFPIKQGFALYSRYVIPFLGRTISGDKHAYRYLPESVEAFPEGDNFCDILRSLGYRDVTAKRLTDGVATIYSGVK